jgi:CheY-like chemotaxis protein
MPLLPPGTILVVEDDCGHSILITKALRRAHITKPITTLHNGQEAVDLCCATGPSSGGDFTLPLLMILDLRLPGLSGLQVLQRIQGEPKTRSLPVILVSTVEAPNDLSQCQALGYSICLTKPVPAAQFLDTIRQMGLDGLIDSHPYEKSANTRGVHTVFAPNPSAMYAAPHPLTFG